MNKNRKQINIKSLLCIYVFFNIINFEMHVFGHYECPMFQEVDYGLYIIKIVLSLYLYRKMIGSDARLKLIAPMFKLIAVLDVIELLINLFKASDKGVEVFILVGIIAVKSVVDTLICFGLLEIVYKEFIHYQIEKLVKEYRDYKRIWVICNIIILTVIIIEVFKQNSSFIRLINILIIARALAQLFIIRETFKYFESQNPIENNYIFPCEITSKFGFFKKLQAKNARVVICVIIGIMLVGFIYLRYSYQYEKVDERDGDYLEYNFKNKMPKWSCFYDEKYGILNEKTGIDTGAKYKDRLCFDKNGIAYDCDRHFINFDGEEVLKVPYIVKAKCSLRQKMLNNYIKHCDYNDKSNGTYYIGKLNREYNHFIEGRTTEEYFPDGLTAYHCELNDKYGLLKDDGTLITGPIYRYVTADWDYDMTIAIISNGDEQIFNSKGEALFDEPVNVLEAYNTSKLISYSDKETDKYYCKLMTFTGEKLEGVYDNVYEKEDITYAEKIVNVDTGETCLEMYHGDSELIKSID